MIDHKRRVLRLDVILWAEYHAGGEKPRTIALDASETILTEPSTIAHRRLFNLWHVAQNHNALSFVKLEPRQEISQIYHK